jgi:predicted nuclease of predicted toxin-antitoxin system
MRLYLDEDAASPLLAKLLRKAGHDTQLPTDVGQIGEEDPVQLKHAIKDDRALLSYNYRDFEMLHELIMQAQGHHPGILIVRRDNDPKRDLSAHGIVRAIRNLSAASVLLRDGFVILNQWR